jgi:hypothetical protein
MRDHLSLEPLLALNNPVWEWEVLLPFIILIIKFEDFGAFNSKQSLVQSQEKGKGH